MGITRSLGFIKLATKVSVNLFSKGVLLISVVPSYQPEVSYELFMRSLFNRDMSTGLLSFSDDYKTIGPDNTWHIKNEIPERPEPVCYVLDPNSCTNEQFEAVINGTAIVKNYVVVGFTDKQQSLKHAEENIAQEILGKEDL
jgi:hypothetical protein